MDIFLKLKEACERHDWYYQMSDDRRYYAAGAESSRKLLNILAEARATNLEIANEIYERYAPKW